MPPSAPVITDRWAGNFDCSGPCRRKRLVGDDFSKKMLERHRKIGADVRCKRCVAEVEAEERRAARERAEARTKAETGSGERGEGGEKGPVPCAACRQSLPPTSYNRNQLAKGSGKARCRVCVEKAVNDEAASAGEAKKKRLEDAQKAVRDAERKGDLKAKLAAESVLSALEAEKVTGLAPVKLGRGRGRGGRWGSGRGRGSPAIGRGRGRAGRGAGSS